MSLSSVTVNIIGAVTSIVGLLGLVLLAFAVLGMYRFGSVLNRVHAVIKCGLAGTLLLLTAFIILAFLPLQPDAGQVDIGIAQSRPDLSLRLIFLTIGLSFSLIGAGRLIASLDVKERRKLQSRGAGLNTGSNTKLYDEMILLPDGNLQVKQTGQEQEK